MKAFVLAAGRGERMKPLTDTTPKPLLTVAGTTMLDRCLDALEKEGVEEVVVNAYYLADKIETHLKQRKTPRLVLSRETEKLETGGGMVYALHHFDDAFFALNADAVWTEAGESALSRLSKHWDEEKMDLLLLVDDPRAGERGDYFLEGEFGQPVFGKNAGRANVSFIGPRIVHPRLFKGETLRNFSFLELMHKAEKSGQLYALKHHGKSFDVGTPETLAKVDALLG